MTQIPVQASKRKSKGISRDEETSESESDEQPIETSSKRRKVDKKNGAAIDSKLVIRNTRPVVEIPAMTSSPVVKSRSPRSAAKNVRKPEVVEILSEDEDEKDEDSESNEEEESNNGIRISSGEKRDAGDESTMDENQDQSDRGNTDKVQGGSIATEHEEKVESASEQSSDIKVDNCEENIVPRNGSKQSTSLLIGNSLPDLLPMELFDDDDTLSATEPQQVQVKPKKLKFTDFVEPPPRDRRFGSTTFHVSKKQNSKLAPKATHQARSMKEAWLRGRVGKSVGNNRKPFTKGFFTSKK
ncbi:hypothetical protein BGZ60DRAFT_21043 [Tricladium varicosporioides]|nr:hypothetical protein BGZ60DRAFT_21043 [Hymenoscyphus varicosporioides]